MTKPDTMAKTGKRLKAGDVILSQREDRSIPAFIVAAATVERDAWGPSLVRVTTDAGERRLFWPSDSFMVRV